MDAIFAMLSSRPELGLDALIIGYMVAMNIRLVRIETTLKLVLKQQGD